MRRARARAVRLLRGAWRRGRALPGVSAVVRLGDAALWTVVIARSGEVDPEFVAAQVDRDTLSNLGASRIYAFGGFRRGLSPRPDLDEAFAAGRLPEGDRVPALYSYLRHREDVSPALLRDALVPALTRTETLRAARDWARGVAPWEPLDEIPGLTVVLLGCGGDPRLAGRLRDALTVGDRVVAVVVGPSAADAVILRAAEQDDRVVVGSFPAHTSADRVLARLLPPRGRVVVVDPGATVRPEDIAALAAGIRPDRVVVPVELAADDTVAAAGSAVIHGRATPLFAGLPLEDVRRIGEPFEVPERAGTTFAAALPLTAAATTWVDPSVVLRPGGSSPGCGPATAASESGRDAETTVRELYGRAGYEVLGWSAGKPRLRRTSTTSRWAVKVASLAGSVGDVWGDTHFGEALADALRRRGLDAVVDRREAANRDSSAFDDVHLIVRGPTRIAPPRHGVRILWIISHPHEITAEELAEFDLVFAASARWAAAATQRFGRPIEPLWECTDATRYRPEGRPRSGDILFVGKSRDVPRRVVMAPIEAGVPVKVYGPDWSAYIPEENVVAPFVPLDALPEMYERASVVLNDQWAEMREAGFPAMRPFDVIAAGGRVVSEEVDGLREALGPGVVTYRSEAELVAILQDDDLDRFFPSDVVLRENAERVRLEHSFDARAAALDEAVLRRDQGRG